MKPLYGILEIITDNKDVLPRAFRYLVDHNKSNDAPYHNLNHMLSVTQWCYDGALFHRLDDKTRNNLLIAALFHDFNHSQGVEDDEWNISVAIKGVIDWYYSNPMNKTNCDLTNIVSIIQATQYPYVIEADKLTVPQQIIRDADLMMALNDDWLGSIIVGLGKEMGYNIKEMAEGQYKFHTESVKMNSEWGKSIHKNNKHKILSDLERLRGLL